MGGHIYPHELKVDPYGTELQSRMNAAAKSGGGIKPNAHPEFSQPTPLDKTVAAVKGLFKKKNAAR